MALAYDCLFLLRKMNYNPTLTGSRNLFRVGLCNSVQVIDLVNKINNKVFNLNKIENLREACTNGIGL